MIINIKAKYKDINFNCTITEEQLLFRSVLKLVKLQFKYLYPDIKVKDKFKIIGYEISL